MAIIISHSHFVHVAFVSILVFQTFDRMMFDTLNFPGTRWYVVTVADPQMVRDQKQWPRRKFPWGCFVQWQMVVICTWCVPFVASQFDVIFMFPNNVFLAKFVDTICIFCYTYSPCFVCHCIEYKLSALHVSTVHRRKIPSTLQHSSS